MKRLIVMILFCFLALPHQGIIEAAESNLDPGHYQVPVALYHAYSDKLSMGNKGLGEKADVIFDGKNFTIYLEAKKMSFSSITTSLFRFYVGDDEEKRYHLAEKKAYQIEIPGKSEKRPSVFVFTIKEQPEFLKVLVDPQVSFMGNKPLAARLKINWSDMKKVSDESAGPFKLAKESEDEEEGKANKIDDGNVVLDLKGALIRGNLMDQTLSRKDLQERGLALDPLDQVKGYHLALVGDALTLPYEEAKWGDIEKPIMLKEPVRIYFKNVGEIQKVYQYRDGKFIERSFNKTTDGISLETSDLGDFALVKENHMAVPQTKKMSGRILAKSMAVNRPAMKVLEKAAENIPVNTSQNEAFSSPNEKSESPSERAEILMAILFIYLLMGISGFCLCFKFWLKFKDELERYAYILSFNGHQEEKEHEK